MIDQSIFEIGRSYIACLQDTRFDLDLDLQYFFVRRSTGPGSSFLGVVLLEVVVLEVVILGVVVLGVVVLGVVVFGVLFLESSRCLGVRIVVVVGVGILVSLNVLFRLISKEMSAGLHCYDFVVEAFIE
ncbi:hypothetical protein C2G38_2180291 [Gigaspora rosea]|uniref:Uncharacterized protein n=1 Tax=Gigaspora rosea TaxID=44941 RepID=A0A397VDX7_9GLOM|nr:hypothetical protein C2G38_2180291 [Gigaspora rosea]